MSENTNLVTLDNALALKGKKAIEFFSVEANITPLIKMVQDDALSIVPDVSTKKGRDDIGSLALKVSKSRKRMTDAMDESLSSLKSQVSSVKETIKIVESKLNQTRKDILKPRDDWQEEQDKIEQERIDGIKVRVENIRLIGVLSGTETKEDIADLIEAVENTDISVGFEEFTSEVSLIIKEMLKLLNDRVIEIINEEQQAAQALALEEANKKAAVQERLNKLMLIPTTMFGKTSKEIQNKIDSIKNVEIKEDEFGELTGQATTAVCNVESQLKIMFDQQKLVEKTQAENLIASWQEALKVSVESDSVEYVQAKFDWISSCENRDNKIFTDLDEAHVIYNDCCTGIASQLTVLKKQAAKATNTASTQKEQIKSATGGSLDVYETPPQGNVLIENEKAIEANADECDIHTKALQPNSADIKRFINKTLDYKDVESEDLINDFGYLLISGDHQNNLEAMGNLRSKFKTFLKFG